MSAAERTDNAVHVIAATLLLYPEVAFAGTKRTYRMASAVIDALDAHGYVLKKERPE